MFWGLPVTITYDRDFLKKYYLFHMFIVGFYDSSIFETFELLFVLVDTVTMCFCKYFAVVAVVGILISM